MSRTLDHAQLRRLLPHAHPMLLVDRLEQVEPRSGVGIKAISASEACFREVQLDAVSHGFAYPRTLIAESFGQTAAALWLSALDPLDWSCNVLMLTTMRDVQFLGDAFPGDVVRHDARIDNIVQSTVFVSGNSTVGNQLIARYGSLMATRRQRLGGMS